jgi:hypothetical protein
MLTHARKHTPNRRFDQAPSKEPGREYLSRKRRENQSNQPVLTFTDFHENRALTQSNLHSFIDDIRGLIQSNLHTFIDEIRGLIQSNLHTFTDEIRGLIRKLDPNHNATRHSSEAKTP